MMRRASFKYLNIICNQHSFVINEHYTISVSTMLKGNKRMMRGYFADGDLERFSRFDTCFGYNMMNSPFTWVGMLFHVLLVIAFIVLLVYIVKHIWNQPGKKVEIGRAHV